MCTVFNEFTPWPSQSGPLLSVTLPRAGHGHGDNMGPSAALRAAHVTLSHALSSVAERSHFICRHFQHPLTVA